MAEYPSVGFSHVDNHGRVRMVDVSGKSTVKRTARAEGKILLDPDTVRLIKENRIAKGEVLAAARIAGVMAAKRTADLIPLCHNIEIDWADVQFRVEPDAVEITGTAVCTDRTGIEMEALTMVSVAALTIYDMCKAVDKDMRIEGIRLVEKTKEDLDVGEDHKNA